MFINFYLKYFLRKYIILVSSLKKKNNYINYNRNFTLSINTKFI